MASTLVAAGMALWAALPASAASTVYQAENATRSGGTVVATDHAGYTGSGFVGGYTDANKPNANTTFSVTATAAGSHTLTFRYANGTTANMTLSVYVNGVKIRQTSLPATANWDSWGTRDEVVALNSGANSVSLKFDSTDSGNINLDSLTVTDVPAPPAGTYQAETASLSGGASVATDHAGYTGSGFVGGYTDGNKPNATTTFSVSVTSAGVRAVTIRYANGTGSTRTMSLSVNGASVRQLSLPATANWDSWGTIVETVTLNSGANTIAIRYGAADSGNINLDNIVLAGAATSPSASPSVSPSASPSPSPSAPPAGGEAFELETAFLSGGPTTATSVGGFTGTGYATGFTAVGARAIRTVNANAAGNAVSTLRYHNGTGSTKQLSVHVNGLRHGTISLPAGTGWLTAAQTLPLRSGLNLIGYQYDAGDSGNVSLDSVTVAGASALASRGATVPYTEYEAENGSTNGEILAANRTYGTFQSESSGRRAVRLDATGEYVQFTLTKPANSAVIRFSIPDNAAGTGTTAPIGLYSGATKLTDVSLSSTYSWVYGDYPYINNPAGSNGIVEPHRFYDEVRVTFGNQPAGTVLKLQKDASSSAPWYVIDLVDTEQVAPALAMPATFLSITSYGAVSGDAGDDTTAIRNAIAAGTAQGRGVWIPAGTFVINDIVSLSNVSVRGAGMWHSTIKGTNGKGGFMATGSNTQLADFHFAGDVRVRVDAEMHTAVEGNFGTGSLLHNVWIEHAKVGMWITHGTNGLYAAGMRIRDTFADGVNLRGNVINARVDQSVLRNTGDDALAMWSSEGMVTNSAFTFNTAQAPVLANTAGVYGGGGNRIEDNLFFDTNTASAGIAVGTRFVPTFTGTTWVQRNTLTRTGGLERNWPSNLGALWIYADTADISQPIVVKDLIINDSTYSAILISWQKNINNLTIENVQINGAGLYGIEIIAYGSATFTNVDVTGAAAGGLNNGNGYTVVRGAGNSGW
jgi:hypothetical protein